jgi:hypothetical protein
VEEPSTASIADIRGLADRPPKKEIAHAIIDPSSCRDHAPGVQRNLTCRSA